MLQSYRQESRSKLNSNFTATMYVFFSLALVLLMSSSSRKVEFSVISLTKMLTQVLDLLPRRSMDAAHHSSQRMQRTHFVVSSATFPSHSS